MARPEVIEDVGRCREVVDVLSRESVLAVDCEGVQLGVDGPLTLVQVGNYAGQVYLFDIQLNKDLLRRGRLGTLLESNYIVKVMQSCSNDSAALFYQFGVNLRNVFDTQITLGSSVRVLQIVQDKMRAYDSFFNKNMCANLVIQEHKGRKLAPPLKLAVICEEYGGKRFSTGLKDDIQTEWMKVTGDMWAIRPMTEDMILYAAGDVTAIVPEVYENQKRYLEENHLLAKFEERVQEEILYLIDQSFKQKRRDRVDANVKEIIRNINGKYSNNADISDFDENADEYRALQRVHFKEAAGVSALIDRLKTELIKKELTDLSEKLDQEGEDFLLMRSKVYIFDYEKHPDKLIADTAKSVSRKLNEVALKDVCTKYDMKSEIIFLRQIEKEALRSMRPSGYDDPNVPQVALRLYWLLMEEDMQKKIDEFREKQRSFKMAEGYYKKLKFYIARRTRVPESLKQKAWEFKKDLDRTFGRDVVPSGTAGN